MRKKDQPIWYSFHSAGVFLLLTGSLLLTSCVVRGYTYDKFYPTADNGWHKSGYWSILEPQFQVDVEAADDNLSVFVLTKFNAPHWIKDTVSTVHFTKFIPYFENGDTLIPDTTSGDGFRFVSRNHEKITAYKDLHLIVAFECDSAGSKAAYERNYLLRRRTHYWLSVH